MDEIIFDNIIKNDEAKGVILAILGHAIVLETGTLNEKNQASTRQYLRGAVGRLNYLVSKEYEFKVNENGTLFITQVANGSEQNA